MSPEKLKVYGWGGHRPNTGTHHGQTREIVAARSMAHAARLSGHHSPRQMWCITETGNPIEIAVAMNYATRGCVCWKPLDNHDPLSWKRDPLRTEVTK
jgi:hypothetical protein